MLRTKNVKKLTKEQKKYRKELKKRVILVAIITVALVGLSIFSSIMDNNKEPVEAPKGTEHVSVELQPEIQPIPLAPQPEIEVDNKEKIEKDTVCIGERNEEPIELGWVTAGTMVTVVDETEEKILIVFERYNENCWVDKKALNPPDYIYPVDLQRTLKWEILVERWLPSFPETLTKELVMSIIYKETKGDPHAVDQTGNDIRMVGRASVGMMGAIPRPHLPCYIQLTGSNGKDEYACQIYLGMFILDSAIKRAYEIRTGEDVIDTSRENEDLDITQEDVELGIALYGCTEKNVLTDNCLPWGGETYVRLVIDVILPEIQQALEKQD